MSVEKQPDTVGTAPIRPITKGALIFYGICRFIAVGVSRLYFPGRVIGAENLPTSGPYVLAPVHRSYVDWLVVARVTRRRLRYLVKGELWKVRSVGHLLELLGAFPVRRGSADREAFNRALEVLSAGEPLVLFPEGTRNSGPTIGDMREGASYLALRAGVPIVPVGFSGTDRAMPRGARFPRPARVLVVVGEPIEVPPRNVEVGDRPARIARSATHALTEELREHLQQVLDQATGQLQGRRLGSPDGATTSGPVVASDLAASAQSHLEDGNDTDRGETNAASRRDN